MDFTGGILTKMHELLCFHVCGYGIPYHIPDYLSRPAPIPHRLLGCLANTIELFENTRKVAISRVPGLALNCAFERPQPQEYYSIEL